MSNACEHDSEQAVNIREGRKEQAQAAVQDQVDATMRYVALADSAWILVRIHALVRSLVQHQAYM